MSDIRCFSGDDHVATALSAFAAALTPADYQAAKDLTEATVEPVEQLAMIDTIILAAYRTGVR